MRWTLHSWRVAIAIFVAGFALLLRATPAQAEDDFQWAYRFGNSQDSEVAAASVNNEGDIFVAGIFRGNVDFDPGPGVRLLIGGAAEAGFIAKYSPAGNLIWARSLTGSDNIHISDIVVDDTDHIGVVGSFRGEADLDPGPARFLTTSKGLDDIFLLHLLPDGSFDWAWTGGHLLTDGGVAIAAGPDSDLYIAGEFEIALSIETDSASAGLRNEGEDDVFVARFDSTGGLVWARAFGGKDDDGPTDIALDAAGNVYVVGAFEDKMDSDPSEATHNLHSYGNSDIFVVIFSANGDWLWSTHMGSVAQERNARVLIDTDGSFYVAGEFDGRADFNEDDQGGTITNVGRVDVFLARYGPRRDFPWVIGIGGSRTDSLAGIAQDAFGSVYVLGTYESLVDFDPGPGQALLTGSGRDDIFLASYTRQGALRRVHGMVNPLDDLPGDIAVDPNDNVIFAGAFRGTLDLGFDLAVSTGEPEHVLNVFLARYARDTWTPLPLRAYFPWVTRDDGASR
jgi:hypothetical protein